MTKLIKGVFSPKQRLKNGKEVIKQKWINDLDAEIMDWVYEIIEINFGATMIQDSTELREILNKYFDKRY